MIDDYTKQVKSDTSGPTFHISARYMLINGQRMLDILAISQVCYLSEKVNNMKNKLLFF